MVTSKAQNENTAPLSWEHTIPLLNNPFVWWDYGKVILISLIIIQLLVLALSYFIEGDPVWLPPQAWLIPLGILLFLFIPTALLLRNGIPARFTLDAKRVLFETVPKRDRYERGVNLAVKVLVVLFSGLPGLQAQVFGPGSAAEIRWREVHKVRIHRNLRVITLNDSWHAVLRLYVPAELWEQAVTLCQRYAAESAARRAKRAQRAGPVVRRPFRSYLGWGALAALGTLACWAWPWSSYDATNRVALLAGLITLAVALAQQHWWSWLLAWPGAVVSIVFLGKLAYNAIDPITSLSGQMMGYGYELDTPLLALAALGGLILLGINVHRLVQQRTDEQPAKPKAPSEQANPPTGA